MSAFRSLVAEIDDTIDEEDQQTERELEIVTLIASDSDDESGEWPVLTPHLPQRQLKKHLSISSDDATVVISAIERLPLNRRKVAKAENDALKAEKKRLRKEKKRQARRGRRIRTARKSLRGKTRQRRGRRIRTARKSVRGKTRQRGGRIRTAQKSVKRKTRQRRRIRTAPKSVRGKTRQRRRIRTAPKSARPVLTSSTGRT